MAIEGVTVAVVIVDVVVGSKMIVVFINGPAVAAGGSRPWVEKRIPRVVFCPARGSGVDGAATHAASAA